MSILRISRQTVPAQPDSYLFYGPIQTNAIALLRSIEQAQACLTNSPSLSIFTTVFSLENRVALEMFRAGHWDHAFSITTRLRGLLESLSQQGSDEVLIPYQATSLLNLARLWAARGDFASARSWFQILLSQPFLRCEVILPEVVRAASSTGAVADALMLIDEHAYLVGPENMSHFARARAALLMALGQPHAAQLVIQTVDQAVFSPIDQCWFNLEQATVLESLGELRQADPLHVTASHAIDQLRTKLPSTSPMPLLLGIALAEQEANANRTNIAADRLRRVRDRALGVGLECIALRAASKLVIVLSTAGLYITNEDLRILLELAQNSRYRSEVLEAWWSLGYALTKSNAQDEAELGAAYLGRLVVECAEDELSIVRQFAISARELTDRYEIVVPLPQRRFFDGLLQLSRFGELRSSWLT